MAATIIPGIRYRDAKAAIDWLCTAFGFMRGAIYPDEDGGVAHAQLTHGDGMLMLSSMRDDAYGALLSETGAGVTQAAYVIVPDPDAHYARAVAAGAEVVLPLETKPHGRGYSCRDCEGHIWHFGDYDPWRAPPPD